MTVRQFVEAYPAFTESGVRKLLFRAELNRLDEVTVRVGRRILIDAGRFEKWLDLPPKERESKTRPRRH